MFELLFKPFKIKLLVVKNEWTESSHYRSVHFHFSPLFEGCLF